jgi:hypothetical protein
MSRPIYLEKKPPCTRAIRGSLGSKAGKKVEIEKYFTSKRSEQHRHCTYYASMASRLTMLRAFVTAEIPEKHLTCRSQAATARI